MKKSTLGYIVVSEYWSEPLELCRYEGYPELVLLRADNVTVFQTQKAANQAIEQTLEWARIRETEDEALTHLDWAERDKYKVWRLCPVDNIAVPIS